MLSSVLYWSLKGTLLGEQSVGLDLCQRVSATSLLPEGPEPASVVIAFCAQFHFFCLLTVLRRCWHESSDTPMFYWAINLSCGLCLCFLAVEWLQVSCVSRAQMLCQPPVLLGPRWHCSMWPIVRDPGSGGNSWWILQHQPAWHQPAWHRDSVQATLWNNCASNSPFDTNHEGQLWTSRFWLASSGWQSHVRMSRLGDPGLLLAILHVCLYFFWSVFIQLGCRPFPVSRTSLSKRPRACLGTGSDSASIDCRCTSF